MKPTRAQMMDAIARSVQERREELAREEEPSLSLLLARYNILSEDEVVDEVSGIVRSMRLSWLACELDDTPPINIAPEGTEDVPPGARDMVIVRLHVHPVDQGLEHAGVRHRRVEGLDPHWHLVAYEEPLHATHVLGTTGEWIYEGLHAGQDSLDLEDVLYLFNAACDDIRYRTGRFIMAALDDPHPPEGVWVDTDAAGEVIDDEIDLYPGNPR